MTEVITIKARFYSFGRALGLPSTELDTIRSANSQNLEQGLNDVTLVWLHQKYNTQKYGSPTWQRLVEAVDDPAGGDNHALAKTIASHHPTGSFMYSYMNNVITDHLRITWLPE